MKVTLQVNGREMFFSAKKRTPIVEKHLVSQTTGPIKRPTEGEWFQVNPTAINKELFKEKRSDERQEWTRQIILDALAEVKNNPEEYAKPFETLMPEKKWSAKTIEELKKLASNLGDHMADWVEQALEWAQRITNGETWEAVCNNADVAKWYRLTVWKRGFPGFVGGSRKNNNESPASHVLRSMYPRIHKYMLSYTVPLVVRHRK